MLRYFLMAAALLTLAACSNYKANTQVEAGTFLQLKGAFANTELIIDDQPRIIIDKSVKTFKIDGYSVAKFSISQGTHTVKVVRDGQTVVNRKVFVSEGNVFEVTVP